MIFLSFIKTYLLLCDVNWQVHHRLVDALEDKDWHLDIVSEYCFWNKDDQDDQNILLSFRGIFLENKDWQDVQNLLDIIISKHLNWEPAPCESFPQSLQVSSGSQAPQSQGRSPFDTRQQLVFKLVRDKSSIFINMYRTVPYCIVSYVPQCCCLHRLLLIGGEQPTLAPGTDDLQNYDLSSWSWSAWWSPACILFLPW